MPLICFGGAAIRVPLVTLGLLQYLAPILQFALGVLCFHEAMPAGRWIGFALVWVALGVFTAESLRHRRRQPAGRHRGGSRLMPDDLFAGLPVSDYERALAWHTRFWGAEPSFLPNDVEAVWQVGPHQFVYVVVRPDHAGHGALTLFLRDLDARVAAISGRGLRPSSEETYENGVTKVTYHDPDGNELGFGGGPA